MHKIIDYFRQSLFNEESKIIHTSKSYCRQGKKHPLDGEEREDLAEEASFAS